MPELPEVEVIARRLRNGNTREKKIVGRTVTAAHVPSTRAVREPSRAAFAKQIEGARFVDVKRRAKYLLLETDRGVLLVHLRLTGDLHVLPAGDEPRFLRVALDLDDGNMLAFTDGRHLGEVRFVASPDAQLADLGPEPLDPAFTVDVLARALQAKRPVKAVLLDQSSVAGVGNIYSDEACFIAKVHPATPASSLARADVKRLHGAILKALRSSIDDILAKDKEIAWRYADRSSESPFFVYDRAGEPCRRCGTKLVAQKIAGRTSVVCPRCQPKPKRVKAR
jgi:formamidopyrimidine-DNA glycosylase